MMTASPSRPLAWLLAQAGVIALMGPVILVLAGGGDVSWTAAVASLKLTGPLAAVVLGGQLLLRWSDHGREAQP